MHETKSGIGPEQRLVVPENEEMNWRLRAQTKKIIRIRIAAGKKVSNLAVQNS